MTTTNDMEFEFKCLHCGTVYRSELAHVGKHIQCRCGSLVKVVPPLESLIEPTIEQSKSASTKTSTGKKVPWFAVAGVVIAIAAVVFAARFTVERGRSDQSGQSAQAGNRVIVGEQPAKATTDEATDVRPISYHTLPTGTHLEEDIETNGHGKLTVENGTDEDAAVRLYNSDDQPVRSFFVQAHNTGRVGQIPEGLYRLAFTTGLDYIELDDSFRWHPEYFDFDKTFVFVEKGDSEHIRYKDLSVTLHTVPEGNIQRRSISREQFLKGHHHAGSKVN